MPMKPKNKKQAPSLKLGELKRVKNDGRITSAQKEYWVVHCTLKGESVTLMLTKSQLSDLQKRAERNPEDIPPKGKVNFFAKLFGA